MFSISTFVVLLTVTTVFGLNNDENEITAPDGSTFRRDYKYFPSVNGWMKLHVFPEQWLDARLTCANEGARLASPINSDMQLQMTVLLQTLKGKAGYTGINSIATVNDYFSVEGVPLSSIPVTWAKGEPDNVNDDERCLAMTSEGELMDKNCNEVRPYICYREKVGEMTMNECGNYDNEYVRDNRTGSCYKFHEERTAWKQAHSVCTAEGGHLAIINSEIEAQVLAELTHKHKNDDWTYVGFSNWARAYDAQRWYTLDGKTSFGDTNRHGRQEWRYGGFSGYRFFPHLAPVAPAPETRQWYTLDGKTLQEAGFARWAKNEPNTLGGREDCGSFIQKNGENLGINDSNCSDRFPYICEVDKEY